MATRDNTQHFPIIESLLTLFSNVEFLGTDSDEHKVFGRQCTLFYEKQTDYCVAACTSKRLNSCSLTSANSVPIVTGAISPSYLKGERADVRSASRYADRAR